MVADSLAILDDATSRDGESKIRQIGGNCVVGLSGDASVALGILAATGWYDRRGIMDVAVEAERVACALRLYRVGDTTEASWWEKKCPRDVVLQGVACHKPPFIGGLLAGFTGRDLATPAVYSIKQDEAFSTFSHGGPVAIGDYRFSTPILNDHYQRALSEGDKKSLLFLGSLCILVTKAWARTVNSDLRGVYVYRDSVKEIPAGDLAKCKKRAEEVLSGWSRSIISGIADSRTPAQG